MCQHEHAHLAVIRALDVIDDTVLLHKVVRPIDNIHAFSVMAVELTSDFPYSALDFDGIVRGPYFAFPVGEPLCGQGVAVPAGSGQQILSIVASNGALQTGHGSVPCGRSIIYYLCSFRGWWSMIRISPNIRYSELLCGIYTPDLSETF